MITSRTKNENYLGYLILEIIMVAVITFLGTAFLVFYLAGRSDNRNKTHRLEYLFDHPAIFGLICIAPAILAIGSVLYFRNRNYIVGYAFDDDTKILKISYRGVLSKTIKQVTLPYEKLETVPFSEKKVLFNQAYKGIRILMKEQELKLDFVTNNFIWEKQPRERVYFLEELKRIEQIQAKLC